MRNLFVVLLAVIIVVSFVAALNSNAKPEFNETSTVVVSDSGQYALVTNDKIVSNWINYDGSIQTADGGKIVILLEYKSGKPIGAIGWKYEGGDPNSRDDGDKSDYFGQYIPDSLY